MGLLVNRAKANTSTTGTGTVSLGTTVATFQSWVTAGAVTGSTYSYLIEDGISWEIGQGVFTAGAPDTITRSLVASSSGALINLSGSATIACVANKDDYGKTGELPLVPPVVGNFTYGGGGSGSMPSAINGVQIRAPNSGATYNARAVCTTGGPASFANFTVTARMKRLIAHTMGGGGAGQLFIRNSSNGRMLVFNDGTNGTVGQWQRWQNDTTFNANIATWTLIEGGAMAFPWRRIVVSGSSASPSWSSDGYNWESTGTAEPYATYLTAAGGAADQVGFSVHTVNGSWVYSVCQHFSIT